jgi:phosphoglycerate dehydrogenase-like enzyme
MASRGEDAAAIDGAGERRATVLWRSRLGADEVREEAAPEGVRIVVDEGADAAAAAGARILVDGDPPDELLDVPTLERVIVPYAGVRAGLRERIAARPRLTLHNSHFNAPFVAQHAFALLLACAARLPRYDGALRSGDWGEPDGPASVHLAGKTALLVGYGAIGRALAPMLRGVGMVPEALRRRPSEDADGVRQWGPDRLHVALARADAVIVSLPSTPATTGLLDAAAFAAMRPGAILVNVGRGDVVDEDAAWDALNEGRLTGVGLDVWWRYPEGRRARPATLPAHRPFHRHPDVVLSPHRANAVRDWRRASVRDVLATIAAIRSGGDRNRVDVAAGY